MNIRANKYNDPALGAAFENIASLFAPMSAQDTVAYNTARAKKDEAERLSWLFNNPTDPTASARSALIGTQGYGQTPAGFTYKVDSDAATAMRGQDVTAATSRANNSADNARALQTNAADNQRATVTSLYGPLNPGQLRPEVPADIAGVLGLPAMPSAAGAPKPLSETEFKGGQMARLVEQGAVPEDRLLASLFPDANAGGTEYGLAPVYGRDKDGNVVVMQLGKDGTAKATAIPEGVTPDLSTKSYEAALGTEMGKQGAASVVGENSAVAKATSAIALLDSITGGADGQPDPALDSITGIIQGRLPPLTQAGTDLNAKVAQLQGQAFLAAFESLKGGGAITEIEGQKATDAIARLSRTQSPEAFVASLEELRGMLEVGVTRARDAARRGAPAVRGMAPPPDAPPAAGGVVDVATPEDAMKLPSGTQFRTPDGRLFEVP